VKSEHLHSYKGNLEFYFETGMEQMGTIFHDDRGLHEGPHYSKPGERFMYKSLEWSIWFGQRMCIYDIKIFNPDGTVAYEGPLVKDKKKMHKDKYSTSFLPAEMDKRTWMKYCGKEYRAELRTNDLASALEKQYEIKYGVGTAVVDDVSKRDAIVIGHILYPDLLESRHPHPFRYLVALLDEKKLLGKTYHERSSLELSERKFPGIMG